MLAQKTEKSAIQVSATASCCEGEVFTYIHLASAAHTSYATELVANAQQEPKKNI